jgi:hypothetical protein
MDANLKTKISIKNDKALKHNLLIEKTRFEKLEENIKNSIFGVLFVLLKEEDGSVLLELILIGFELLQLLVYPFNRNVKINRNYLNKMIYFILFSLQMYGKNLHK